MTSDTHLQQQLLELIYGLLSDSRAEELRTRIAAEPAVAQVFARARQTAALFAEAARVKVPPMPLTVAAGPHHAADAADVGEHIRSTPHVADAASVGEPAGTAIAARATTVGIVRNAIRQSALDAPHASVEPAGRGIIEHQSQRRGGFAALAVALAGIAAGILAVALTFESRPSTDTAANLQIAFRIQPARQGLLVAAPRAEAGVPLTAIVGDILTTSTRERRRVVLPDRSVMYLNEDSRAVVESPRRVRIAQGEAYVEVAARTTHAGEHERFVVATADRELTALGTKFAVTVEPEGTRVAVTQGRVAADKLARPLTTGEQLLPAKAAAGSEPSPIAPAPRASEMLAWTRELKQAAVERLVPRSSHAGGALVAVDPSGQEMNLSLRRYHVDVRVEDGFARTTIDQTYFNHAHQQLEGTFYFPLPADASLSRLAMYVAGRRMEGGMAERDYARNVFEQIMYTRRDPALLEWVDGSTFKMRVFPLEARHEKRILLGYTQRLPVAYGRTTYRFPAGHSLEVTRGYSAALRVKDGAGLKWHSPSHELNSQIDGNDLVLSARSGATAIERDIVLELTEDASRRLKGGQGEATNARLSTSTHEGHRYLMLRLRPEFPGQAHRPRRNWVVLFESSGDRDPLLARVQVDAVETILESAEHDDTFAVVTAGTRTRTFDDEPRPCTPENIAEAVEFLENTHLVGGLDLEGALKACRPLLETEGEPYLVHVGSGVPILGNRRTDELAKQVAQLVNEERAFNSQRSTFNLQRMERNGQRLHPARPRDHLVYVGIPVGRRWSKPFMHEAARLTGGIVQPINPDEDARWKAFEMVSTLNAPRLLDASVVDEAGRGRFLNISDHLAHGEELCAVARFPADQPLPKSIRITATLNGDAWEQMIPVENVAEGAGYLPRTWARLEIDRLLAEDAAANRQQIIELSKAMYVMSPFTSLLVLESDSMYQQFGIDRGRQDHWAMYPAPEEIPVVHEPEEPALAKAGDATVEPVAAPRPEAVSPEQRFRRQVQQELDSIVVRKSSGHPGPETSVAEWEDHTGAAHDMYAKIFTPRFDGSEAWRFVTARGVSAADLDRYIEDRLQAHWMAPALDAKPAELLRRVQFDFGQLPGEGRELIRERLSETLGDFDLAYRMTRSSPASTVDSPVDPDLLDRLRVLPRSGRVEVKALPVERAGALQRLEQAIERLEPLEQISQRKVNLLAALNAEGFRDRRRYLFSGPQSSNQPWSLDAGRGLRSYFAFTNGRWDLPLHVNPSPGIADGRMNWNTTPTWAHPLGWSAADVEWDRNGEDVLTFIGQAQHGRFAWPDYGYYWIEDQNGNGASSGADWLFSDGLAQLRDHQILREELETLNLKTQLPGLVENSFSRLGLEQEFRVPVGTPLVPPAFQDTRFGQTVLQGQWLNLGGIPLEFQDTRFGRTVSAGKIDRLSRLFRRGDIAAVDRVDLSLMVTPRIIIQEEDEQLLSSRVYPVGDLVLPIPQLSPPRFFTDLVAHAPGLRTTWTDVAAAAEAQRLAFHSKHSTGDVAREHESEYARQAGVIDPAAGRMIEAARDRGWERVTFTGDAPLVVTCNGGEHFVCERTVSEGLRERVVCDGRTLWHLYPEIGLGARRSASRFHVQELRSLVPWLLPAVDELARTADVRLVDERTVALVPRGPHEAAIVLQLVFTDDGRLAERRWVRQPEGTVLVRSTYGADGAVRQLNGAEQELVKLKVSRQSVGAPELSPETAGLVVLPMPFRTQAWIDQRAANAAGQTSSDEAGRAAGDGLNADRLAAVASAFAADEPGHLKQIIEAEFFSRGDSRLGFYTLLASTSGQWLPADAAGDALRSLNLDARRHHPTAPLARYIEESLATAHWKTVPSSRVASDAGTFLNRLAEARYVYALWNSSDETDAARRNLDEERQRALRVIANCRSGGLAWSLLQTVAAHNDDSAYFKALAEAARRLEDVPALAWTARYHRAAWNERSGAIDEARGLFRSLYLGTLAAGVLPPFDEEFVSAIRESAESRRRWRELLRRLHAICLEGRLRGAGLAVCHEALRMGDAALAAALFERTLANVQPAGQPDLALAGVSFLMQANLAAKAERLLQPLLADERFAASAALWRIAAAAAHQSGDATLAVERIDRAFEIEYEGLPDVVNLETFRRQYGDLFAFYGNAIRLRADEGADLPPDMADRWRMIDPDDTAACRAAAKCLQELGLADVAWDYLTTPLAERPNEAAPWLDLAVTLSTEGRIDKAAVAYAAAFEIEPTNAQILWDHSQLLEQADRRDDARTLYERLAEGTWQPRFRGLQVQARQNLGVSN